MQRGRALEHMHVWEREERREAHASAQCHRMPSRSNGCNASQMRRIAGSVHGFELHGTCGQLTRPLFETVSHAYRGESTRASAATAAHASLAASDPLSCPLSPRRRWSTK